jgi:HSP20 family protein
MATLVRWEPLRELASMQNEMSRWMNGLLDSSGRGAQSWAPALDVWETDTDVVYSFDLPGVPEEQISIEVADGTLTVSAEREKKEEVAEDRYYRVERRFGSYSRAVGLPQGVDESKIGASYRDGVLEVRVPKPEEQKPRKIALSSTIESGSDNSS